MVPGFLANWSAHERGVASQAVEEHALYSDVHLVGQIEEGLGPYQLINGFKVFQDGIGPALFVRIDHCPEGDPTYEIRTDLKRFTGDDIAGEIASLLSLEMGVRLIAGSSLRTFYPDDKDLRGRPQAERTPPPVLTLPEYRVRRLPWPSEGHRYLRTVLFGASRKLGPAAVALVRAARSYRQALWAAEREPEIAWLLFVAALEAAASEHAKTLPDMDDERVFRDVYPELAEELDAINPAATKAAAQRLAKTSLAQRKVLKLLGDFLPPPPTRRPPEGFCIRPWTLETLRKHVKTVYRHRSSALHGAVRFPPPMCSRPEWLGDPTEAPIETVPGLGSATLNGSWGKEDLPFTLHMFEYLVRAVLLGWWGSLVGVSPDQARGTER